MFIKQDWIMQQIEMMVQFIARLIFRKESVTYEVEDETALTDTDMLHVRLKGLLRDKKIGEAENLLFDELEEGNKEHLRLALSFYSSLNKMSDAELEAGDFSREEVYEGLQEIVEQYGVVIPKI